MKRIRARNRSRKRRQGEGILRLLIKYNPHPHLTKIIYQDPYFRAPLKALFPTPYAYVGTSYFPQIVSYIGKPEWIKEAKKFSSSPLVSLDPNSPCLTIFLRGEFTQSTFAETIDLNVRLPEIVLALRYWADHVNWPKRRAEVTLENKLSEIKSSLPVIKNPSHNDMRSGNTSNTHMLLAFLTRSQKK